MTPDYEAMLQRAYEAILRPGDVAVDIGAHVGRHALPMAAKVAPGGRVLAFEPLPACRDSMIYEIWKDGNRFKEIVEIHDCALADDSGETEYTVAADALPYSGLRRRVYDAPTRVETIPVKVRRLDEFIGELERLAYVKIDAEGGEYHALLGARQCLARFRPLVTFEFGENSIGEYGITVEDMGRFWLDRSHLLFDILGRPLATVESFAESARRQAVWDYIAVPAEREDLRASVLSALAP